MGFSRIQLDLKPDSDSIIPPSEATLDDSNISSTSTDLDLLDIFGHDRSHILPKCCQLVVSDGILRPDGGCMKDSVFPQNMLCICTTLVVTALSCNFMQAKQLSYIRSLQQHHLLCNVTHGQSQWWWSAVWSAAGGDTNSSQL